MELNWNLVFAALASISAFGSLIVGYRAIRLSSEERKAREYSLRPYLTMTSASIAKSSSSNVAFAQIISNRGVHPAVDVSSRFLVFDATSDEVLTDYSEAFANEVVSGIDRTITDVIPVDFDDRPPLLTFMGLRYYDALNKQHYTNRLYFKIKAGKDHEVHHPEKPELEDTKKRANDLAPDYF